MKTGIIITFDKNVDEHIRKTAELGIPTVQLRCWSSADLTTEIADKAIAALKQYGVSASAFWCGWDGLSSWNFYDGPLTLGLVPRDYRDARMKMLLNGAEIAHYMGISDVITHVGFIPENCYTTEYHELVAALKYIARQLKPHGQYFLFETGQETPVTLLRTIEDVGTGNLGINIDPANLLMYGKANPTDALDVFGKYVRGVHGKDGEYPTNGRHLGAEKPMGKGRVNFPVFVTKLKEIGYDGPITIEREIDGEEQVRDIITAKEMLEGIFAELNV
jgi:sugar phosphate isomerase/epimerase